MLDKEVFFEKMEELLFVFPNWGIKSDDPKVMKLWFSKFSHMDNTRFAHMVDSYIKNEIYPPTIKGLLDNDTLPTKPISQIHHESMLRVLHND